MSFDPFAEEWNRFRQKPSTALSFFRPYAKGTVLDAGCGNGRNAKILSKTANHVFAADVSLAQVKLAKANTEKEKNVKVQCADFSKLPFKDETFDAIFCLAAFHHVRPKSQPKVLSEFKRALKRGGTLCLSVWNKNQPRFFGKSKQLNIPWKGHPRYYYLFVKEELNEKVSKAGFQVLEVFEEKNGREVKTQGQNLCLIARKVPVFISRSRQRMNP